MKLLFLCAALVGMVGRKKRMAKNFIIVALSMFGFYAWFRLPPKIEFTPALLSYWPQPSDSWLYPPAISLDQDGLGVCVAGKYYKGKGKTKGWTVHDINIDAYRQDIGCNCKEKQ